MCSIVVLVVCRLANWPSVGISCVVSPPPPPPHTHTHICRAFDLRICSVFLLVIFF